MLYGASPMIPARLREGIVHFGLIFLQYYGQAEAPMVVTTLSREEHDLSKPERLASCGRASINVELKLLNECDNEVALGEVGEICVRGPLVSEGYWKRPEETAETFRNGWLRTGDMARMDEEGFCYIVDRSKDVIISGGFNVYPREVEDVLSQHPSVLNAAVIGIPDAKWGESVRAIVVCRAGAYIEERELIGWVREKKGPICAPKAIEFAEAIPMTGLGKPDKKALRARYWGDQERQVG
jgi:fatty-acyl-CoA synthase